MALSVANTQNISLSNSFTKPAGLAENDLLIAVFLGVFDGTQDWSAWTQLGTISFPANVDGYALYRLATSADVAGSTITIDESGTASNDVKSATLYHITGNPISQIASLIASDDGVTASTANSPTFTVSIDPYASNGLFIYCCSAYDAASDMKTISAYSMVGGTIGSVTEVQDTTLSSGGGYYLFNNAYGTVSTATAITSIGFTQDQGSGISGSSTDNQGIIGIIIDAQNDGNGAHSQLQATATPHDSDNQSNTNPTTAQLTATATANDSDNTTANPTRWTNEAKTSTTWTNETL